MKINSKRVRGSMGIIIIAALIFIFSIIGIFAPKTQMLETKGTIVNIEERMNASNGYDHIVHIDYSANGKEYKNVEFGNYDSTMEVDDKVTVLYDPKNPEHIEAKESDAIIYILAATSGILLFVSIKQTIKKLGGNIR